MPKRIMLRAVSAEEKQAVRRLAHARKESVELVRRARLIEYVIEHPEVPVSRAEMRRALETADTLEARTFGILDQLGLLTVADGKREISRGVEIIPTPGETPGHLSVRLESTGRTAYCVGDLYHHEMEVERPEWAVTWADQVAIRASRSVIVQAALAEEALLAATHIRGFGRLAPTPDGVRWEPA